MPKTQSHRIILLSMHISILNHALGDPLDFSFAVWRRRYPIPYLFLVRSHDRDFLLRLLLPPTMADDIADIQRSTATFEALNECVILAASYFII